MKIFGKLQGLPLAIFWPKFVFSKTLSQTWFRPGKGLNRFLPVLGISIEPT